jgi:hypothetical protein
MGHAGSVARAGGIGAENFFSVEQYRIATLYV